MQLDGFESFWGFRLLRPSKEQGGLSSLEGDPLERLGLGPLSYGASGFGCQGISEV